MKPELLTVLHTLVTSQASPDMLSSQVVRAWSECYVSRLTSESSVLDLAMLGLDAGECGVCYLEPSDLPSLASLVGSRLGTWHDNPPVDVARLDALARMVGVGSPVRRAILTGTSSSKALLRADFVVEAVSSAVTAASLSERPRLLMVGVVGEILRGLVGLGYFVAASDYAPSVVGQTIDGVHVQNGKETLDLVRRSDVALVTGMTLGNQSLEQILKVAVRSGCRVVLFCQSGSGLAPYLLDAGATSVVAERYPFYLTPNVPSEITRWG